MNRGRRHDRRKLDQGVGFAEKMRCEAACGRQALFQVDGVGLYCEGCVEEIERRIADRVVRGLVARSVERRVTLPDSTS